MMLTSPLDAAHRALGARMVPFGGWEMPVSYESVIEEHRACRTDAVVFDVSHLGSVLVEGTGAFDTLQWCFTNDLNRIDPGRAQYTHLLDPDDAHVVDDLIVWWLDDDRFVVMPNASNTAPIVTALTEAAQDRDVAVRDITTSRALLAVQGPRARERLAPVLPGSAAVGRFAVNEITWRDVPVIVAGTGYTGEDGFEIQVPLDVAADLWAAILDAGIRPAGLGARDTLRLEMGYPLHGHELGPGITPLEAGLGWVVRSDKGPFRGRDALTARATAGIDRLLFGLRASGRQVPRQGCKVFLDDEAVGEVSSGNFSPSLECGIALAFCTPGLGEGHAVEIDVRGRRVPATVVALPILTR